MNILALQKKKETPFSGEKKRHSISCQTQIDSSILACICKLLSRETLHKTSTVDVLASLTIRPTWGNFQKKYPKTEHRIRQSHNLKQSEMPDAA